MSDSTEWQMATKTAASYYKSHRSLPQHRTLLNFKGAAGRLFNSAAPLSARPQGQCVGVGSWLTSNDEEPALETKHKVQQGSCLAFNRNYCLDSA